ncbi:MAG: hypothetical protein HY776_04980 [Actinobacteria bacterium]|nr:hypothetical protein [Actinomycetota bacterium]
MEASFRKIKNISYWFFILIPLIFVINPSAANASAGDGLLIYGSAITNSTEYSRNWTGSYDTPVQIATSATQTLFSVLKTGPVLRTGNPERIMGVWALTNTNTLKIYRTNTFPITASSDWSFEWQASSSLGTSRYRGFDIAYENLSGDALVAYSTGGTTIYWQHWNGSSWNASGNFTFATSIGNIRWIKLAPRLNSDEIALIAMGSNGSSPNISAAIWNPETQVFENELNTGTRYDAQSGYDSFGGAYESNSGDLLVVWGTSASPRWAYATLPASSPRNWTVNTSPAVLGGAAIYQFTVAPNPSPGSNYIAFAAANSASDIYAGFWTGTTTQNIGAIDTSVNGFRTHNLDIAYAGTTGRSILAYGDAVSNDDIDWAYSGGDGTAFSLQSDWSPTPAGTAYRESVSKLYSDQSSTNVMYLRIQGDNGAATGVLSAYRWDGTGNAASSWSIASNSIDTALSGNDNATVAPYATESFSFGWESVFSIPTLGYPLLLLASMFLLLGLARKMFSG